VKTPQTLAILEGLPKKKDTKYRVSTKNKKGCSFEQPFYFGFGIS
jgi:hypothetical protein